MTKFHTIRKSNPRFSLEGVTHITVKSAALRRRVDTSVYVPSDSDDDIDLPVVVLLHGVYGSHWSWMGSAGAHLTLQKLIDSGDMSKFVLVTPSDGLWGDGSGYVDHGIENYEQWITTEIPNLLREEVDQVTDKSSFYIGGLSMGGWGTLWCGIRNPSIFEGVSAHSAITHIDEMSKFVEEDWTFWKDDNRIHSIQQLIKSRGVSQPIRFDCGMDDLLIEGNRSLHQYLKSNDIDHIYEEFSGSHEWGYWEEHVEKTFRFFDKCEKE